MNGFVDSDLSGSAAAVTAAVERGLVAHYR